jgi:acetate kinase
MSDSPAPQVALALNAGSSSVKLGLYAKPPAGAIEVLATGAAEETDKGTRVWLCRGGTQLLDEHGPHASAIDAAEHLLGRFSEFSLPSPDLVGHRIVHGGPHLREHRMVTPEVLRQLDAAVVFAPLHLPGALELLRRATALFPVSQVACFDTAFHRTMPEYAARLPLPGEYWDKGLRRYGFHGLSCEFIVESLGPQLAARTVIAHLGNGCSLTAVMNGASVETTMGMTPLAGVMMGTRPGDLDPGVLLHLLEVECLTPQQLDTLLNHNSGLAAVSGIGSDMRALLEARPTNASARLAVQMFCYQVRRAIGALTAAMGGIDLLVFTGGIGEHAAEVRAGICAGLEHLGIEAARQGNTAAQSGKVLVLPTNEELQIARHCFRIAASV